MPGFSAYNATIQHYAPNAMAKWIHNWPRRDLSNSEADNTFDPESQAYWETIAIVAAPFVICALLTILFFLTRCLCNCCCWCCKKACGKLTKSKPPKKRPTKTVWVFRATCILVVASLIYGFTANELMREGIYGVRAAILDMDSLKNENIEAIRDIVAEINSVVNSTQSLNQALLAVNSSIPGGVPQSIFDAMDVVVNSFGDGVQSIDGSLDSLSDLPITDATDIMTEVEYYRYNAQLGILLFIAVPFFVVFIAFLCKCRRVLWNVTWIGVLCSTLAWLLSGLEIAGCMAMADMCFEPSQYILDQAASLDSTVHQYAEFYIVCEGIVNPLNSELDSARGIVNDTQAQVDELDAFVDTLAGYGIPTEDLANITTAMGSITGSVDDILDSVEFLINTLFLCNRIHNNYVGSLNGVCNDTVSGMFGLIVVQTALAIMTWLTIYCAIVMYRYLLDQLRQKRNQKNLDGGVSGGDVFAALVSPRGGPEEPMALADANAVYPTKPR